MMVAHHYGLDVVAEGVEKREVLEILRSLGCEKYQGAHFSMPVPLIGFSGCWRPDQNPNQNPNQKPD